jgi:uncharacterized membrane protein YqhA
MKNLIGHSRYLSLVAVFTLLATYVLALFWSVMKAVSVGTEIVTSGGKSVHITLGLIQLVDAFLIAIVLFVLATSVYKLFVGDPQLPSKLVARNLPELKSKLSGIIVLVLAVRFAEAMFEGTLPALEILWLALGTAAVAGALIAFSWFSHTDEKEEA